MKKRLPELFMAVVLLLCAYFLPLCQQKKQVQHAQAESKEYVIMLDAGHGADDSGKVGINGVLEKDINLAIALKVKAYLEPYPIRVVMSRTTDEPLYQETDRNKKLSDMKRRIAIMEEEAVQYLISIHQNSYEQAYVQGAQVFYYTDSVEGERLAQAIQDGFDHALGEKNVRQIKPNREYYLLVHSPAVAVICECGFLSNWEEAEQLKEESYQEKIAESIGKGILSYLEIEE